jgi:hypothetical protein
LGESNVPRGTEASDQIAHPPVIPTAEGFVLDACGLLYGLGLLDLNRLSAVREREGQGTVGENFHRLKQMG